MSFTSPRPFAAKYPGTCTCGASFPVGASIYWDASIRRATLCPACRAPKAVPGKFHEVPGCSGIMVRFDRHPETKAVVLVAFNDPTAMSSREVYRLREGQWALSEMGREMVFSGPVTHATIDAWRVTLGEAA